MARILVVDDVSDVRALVRQILFESGHEVVTAQDATEALEIMNKFRIDLLILDIEMPYINGIRFSEILRSGEAFKFMPIIFLTAKRDEQSVNRAVSVRPEDYLLKPVDKNRLRSAVASVVKRLKIADDAPVSSKRLGLESRAVAIRKDPVRIISASETGLLVRSERRFLADEILHLKADFFEKVGIPNLSLKVGAQRKIDAGNWEIALLFEKPKPSYVAKIRGWLSSRQKRRVA